MQIAHSIMLFTAAAAVTISVSGCATRPASLETRDCGSPSGQCDTSLTTGSIAAATNGAPNRDLSLPPHTIMTGETVMAGADVQAAIARAASARAEIDAAEALRRPQLSLDSSIGYETGSSTPSYLAQDRSSYSYALTANLPLYQGGRDHAALGIAEAQYRASVENIKDVVISTALQLLSSQAAVKRQAGSIAALDKYMRSLHRLGEDVSSEKRMGSATAVDIGEVDRQVLRLQVARKQAVLAMTAAQENILKLTMNTTSGSEVTADSVAGALAEDLPQILSLAKTNNPRIAMKAAQMAAADARIDQARASYNPSANLALSTGLQRSAGARDDDYQTSAVVRVSVPLYTGGARQAAVEGRNQDLKAAALDKDSAVMGVQAAVITAFNRRAQAREMLLLSRRQLTAALAQINGVRQERKLGERTVFNEIQSISDTSDAEQDVVAATYEVSVSEFILAAETGVLGSLIGARPNVPRAPEAAGLPGVPDSSAYHAGQPQSSQSILVER